MKPDHKYAKQRYSDPDFEKQSYLVRSTIVVLFIQVVEEPFDVRVIICTQHSHPCSAVVESEREESGVVNQCKFFLTVRNHLDLH